MGNQLRKRVEMQQEYEQEISKVQNKFSNYVKRNVIIVGPQKCGKSALFRGLLDMEVS